LLCCIAGYKEGYEWWAWESMVWFFAGSFLPKFAKIVKTQAKWYFGINVLDRMKDKVIQKCQWSPALISIFAKSSCTILIK
jgi:hypothetical protein